ncbi:outer membrane protein assembly factor BamB family protein [Cellulomonas xylanilytica]|uniref:Pyrrolo-quinoline quinone repeat domain-containing protein n=1 Tax=Cellulomonas xylanilytica TaxID=233583 RepID=A0A510V6D2_9CELL|nr:PQQ-binding-like beta-propeller repeat protein [Cellulomonas xylanilytica]GEK22412.1 hypothetical protein CXY01_29320 [Cellulomonas xylanilytica]
MSRRDTLAQVELVEDDEPVPPERDPARRPRNRRWLLAVPVVAALLVGVQLVTDARDRAADARVAALPGAVDPLGEDLEVRWRADQAAAPSMFGPVRDQMLHGPVTGPDGAQTYDAVDLRTGELAWSTPLTGPDGRLVEPRTSPTTTCGPWGDPGTDPERVVCLVTDGYQRHSAEGLDESAAPTRSRLVVLDVTDGSVLADHPGPLATSVAVLPGLAATATLDDDQHLVVVANDPLTGEELWRYRGTDPAGGPMEANVTWTSGVGGMVVLSGLPGGPVMLSASGERVETGPDVRSWGTTSQGWFLTERPDPDGGAPVQRVYRPGAAPLEVLGRLLERRVDDGSVPGLEVSTGARTYGWDGRTGDQLWDADVVATPGWHDSVLVLDGTVYLSATGAVVALDARTGETRWTAPRLEGAYWGDLLTDGPHLLLVEMPQDAVGTGFVTALDRRTGTFVRRMKVPAGFPAVVAVGRSLVATNGERVVSLG